MINLKNDIRRRRSAIVTRKAITLKNFKAGLWAQLCSHGSILSQDASLNEARAGGPQMLAIILEPAQAG